MEREPISQKEQIRDALLIVLAGGVISTIGIIAEVNFLSSSNRDVDSIIRFGAVTLAALGLTLNRATRYREIRRSLKNPRE